MRQPIRLLPILLAALSATQIARGDAGVLLPLDREQPDPTVLSLGEMRIEILIDNGDARVAITQIFSSHVPRILEGNYLFALPGRAAVSDFAVWDGVTRIPGVILERKRAEEIYSNLKWQAIDPGLLQMGERGVEEARRTAVFSARVVPIPSYGNKRIEIEYHESVPIEGLNSFFAVPLRPDAYHAQVAGHLSISFELRSEHALKDFEAASKAFPLNITERAPQLVKGTFEGRDVTFQEDFAVKYAFEANQQDRLKVLTYRNPRPSQPAPTEIAPMMSAGEPGFFEVSALFTPNKANTNSGTEQYPSASGKPRTVIILFDTSLSMQWEKLDRSFRALEMLLRTLGPADHFNLLLFNTEMNWFAKQPVVADRSAIEKALDFVRKSTLRGGTDLEQALAASLARSGMTGDSYLVLLSDGDPTRGLVNSNKLAESYEKRWKALPEGNRPRTYVFGIGDDANMPLLRMLGRHNGIAESVRSTEPIDFKLTAFLDKIGQSPLTGLHLDATPATNFDLVYPLEEAVFPGSAASWVGQYRKAEPSAQFDVRGSREERDFRISATVALPAEDLNHASLPRIWARARVDALLAKIEREGEDRTTVDEIIRLARKYKFVTPYTSFLAAPRALLRPRVIRPGDPILRVKTDPSIVSVVALFPFGLIKKLRYLSQEDVWQTRFLAPADMSDGTYLVRLILRDRIGHVYRESKSFVIVSHPPVVRVKLEKNQFRRGEMLRLRVSASEKTRTVVARMYGVAPVYLAWDPQIGSNTGGMVIPADLSLGKYRLTVTAEDIAHNIGSQEVAIEVVP